MSKLTISRMGAASGLNLSDMANINQQATKIATAFNSSATGVNLIAQNLGSGVAGQVTSSLSLGNSSSLRIGIWDRKCNFQGAESDKCGVTALEWLQFGGYSWKPRPWSNYAYCIQHRPSSHHEWPRG